MSVNGPLGGDMWPTQLTGSGGGGGSKLPDLKMTRRFVQSPTNQLFFFVCLFVRPADLGDTTFGLSWLVSGDSPWKQRHSNKVNRLNLQSINQLYHIKCNDLSNSFHMWYNGEQDDKQHPKALVQSVADACPLITLIDWTLIFQTKQILISIPDEDVFCFSGCSFFFLFFLNIMKC